jgi:hypothetical protein
VRASHFRSVSKTVSISEDLSHRHDWRTCHSSCGIVDMTRKFRQKILGCAKLLIECHSIPLWSDRDHYLVALFGTLGFDGPSYNINCGPSDTQEWPPKNKRRLMTKIHLEYHKVHRYERIPDSHRDIFRNSYWVPDRLIC